jgi:hypothetical protein
MHHMALRALLPVFELSTQFEGTEEEPCQWVQCAKTGKFYSKRYKDFSITDEHLSQMQLNFEGEITADYDHYSTMPLEKRPNAEAGKASGWVQKLEKRGAQLWAFVKWTKQAAQLIRNKEFRYISPTIDPAAVTSEGEPKLIGAKLLAIALTNQPFLTGMQAVELSRAGELVELSEVSLDEKTTRIARAFYEFYSGDFDQPYIVPNGIYEDYVICRRVGKLWKVPFTHDEGYESIQFGDAVEVEQTYQELSTQGETMANANEQTPPAGTTTTTQQMPDPVMLSRITNLENELAAQKEVNLRTQRALDETKARGRVLGLIRAGKMAKAQEEWGVAYCLSDPAGFDTYASLLQPILALNTEHGSGETDADVPARNSSGNKTIIDSFVKKVEDYVALNKVSTSDALQAVQSEDPTAAQVYLEALQEESSLSGE